MKDAVVFTLCLGAALCAGCIPLAALLVGAAVLALAYYRTCPHCGAHLDPGEVCDCQKEEPSGADNTERPHVENPHAEDLSASHFEA